MAAGIQESRIRRRNDEAVRQGSYVLHWMQQSQRADFNPALEHAIDQGNRLDRSVIVGFGLMDGYPEANARHYRFMLEGLRDVQSRLGERGIKFVLRHGHPAEVALDLASEASLVVCDRGYLTHQKEWRDQVAEEAGCKVVEVEGDVVVPVEVASDKQEYAARTLRPKVRRRLDEYLVAVGTAKPAKDYRRLAVKSDLDLADLPALLRKLDIDRSVKPVRRFWGGQSEGRRRLTAFLRGAFDGYDERRNEPATGETSKLSPYLHFGHLSPVEIALKVCAASGGRDADRDSYLEELIVRRELAAHFVNFQPDYGSYSCLPEWARKTLEEHRDDPREHVYTKSEMEKAQTHDRYWNAAMREMVHTGFMHNYMRMYWGKKILEWCRTPEYAFRTALELNNRYFLDGRDMSSYANVAWCFGLHDRGWTEREIFGKVRYMNDRGLERKFDMEGYRKRVDDLVAREEED